MNRVALGTASTNMATHTGSEGTIKVATTTVGELRSYSLEQTADTIEEDGIYTDNLTVYGKVNGIPVDPPYYKYTALLDQTGTNDPVAYVKESSFGDIVSKTIIGSI